MSNLIAPSILSADFSELGLEIARIEKAGANLIHVDVMDGHFVPNLTLGMPVIKSLKPKTKIPLDVHLMIEKPEKYIDEFIAAGADYLTLHIESTENMKDCLRKIKQNNVKCGITLRPNTELESIVPYLNEMDLVLVMTVEPGFGGQSFLFDQIEKMKKLNLWRQQGRGNYLIEVDGGVNNKTAPLCWQAGADILVAGSAVFNGEKSAENYKKNIESLRQ